MPDIDTHLRDLFTDEPEHRPVADALATGHRALRRRRIGVAAGALATLVVAGGTAYAVQDGPHSDRGIDPAVTSSPTPTPEPDSSAELLRQCRAGAGEVADESLWDAGTPEVMASHEAWNGMTAAYLRSADGELWSECYVSADGNGYLMPAMVIEPDPGLSETTNGYGFSPACNPDQPPDEVDPDCDRFAVSNDGRLDPEVARVEMRFLDGEWEKVETNEGYYFIEHLGTVPDGYTWTRDGMTRSDGGTVVPLTRVRLLDADGNLLAYWDTSQDGNGPNASNDQGVADLDAYPRIGSQPAK